MTSYNINEGTNISADFNNFEKPSNFIQQLKTLNEQLPSILDDFKKYYVFHNKNPDYGEYQQMFENIKSNLNTTNSNLFMLSNNVQKNTDEINKKLFGLDILIKRERDKNREIKKKLKHIKQENNTTSEMIDNYKEMYQQGYLKNWGLVLSIVLCGISISAVYKKV
jgi:hypothetical protein